MVYHKRNFGVVTLVYKYILPKTFMTRLLLSVPVIPSFQQHKILPRLVGCTNNWQGSTLLLLVGGSLGLELGVEVVTGVGARHVVTVPRVSVRNAIVSFPITCKQIHQSDHTRIGWP